MSANPNSMASVEPWELVAEGYAAEANLVMAHFSRRAIELVAPSASARVIDVAAGPGTLALQLAPHVREVVAVDFSERMVQELRAATGQRELDNITSLVADGQALPFENAQFDAGFSLFGLMFFPDRVRGFQELRRVLKPGAGVVVSSWAPVEDSSLMRAMFGALAATDPAFSTPRKDLAGLENPEILAAELRAGGFREVHVEPVTHSIRPDTPGDLWARMARSSAPLVLLRKRLGETEWQRRSQGALAFLAELLEREPVLSTTALLGFGRAT